MSMFAKLDCSFLALVGIYCQDFTRRNIIYVMSVPAPPTPARNDQWNCKYNLVVLSEIFLSNHEVAKFFLC